MFLIDKASNIIQPLAKKTFSELGFKERAHLQEWIAKHPEALGEKLLVIQKEFSGFIDTYERLDLLALDKKGNLVVIENKGNYIEVGTNPKPAIITIFHTELFFLPV